MKISREEQDAIAVVLRHGAAFGYGNLISHLQTAWAQALTDEGMSEKNARAIAGGQGYPFAMQRDLVERGEWDETGARYAKAKKARSQKALRMPAPERAP